MSNNSANNINIMLNTQHHISLWLLNNICFISANNVEIEEGEDLRMKLRTSIGLHRLGL